MDVLKYFHEEPAALGFVDAPDVPGGVARGYLAGTHLPGGPHDRLRVGLTALSDPALYVAPLVALWGGLVWTRVAPDGTASSVEPGALNGLGETAALVVGPSAPAPDTLAGLAADDEREAMTVAVGLLTGGARAVLWPEPAHDGHDLTVLAAGSLLTPLTDALRRHPAPGARRFVLPLRRARGEHHFYFEQWQLDALPPHIEEV